jgi:AraC-like DNA-binding protein
MDVLTDVLNTVRVSAACYGRVEAAAPWGIQVGLGEDPKFHVILQGRCWLEVEGQGEAVELEAGDLFALPHGHAHALRDAPGTQAINLEELFERNAPDAITDEQRCAGGVLRVGGSGESTLLVSGRVRFDDPRNNPVLRVLPPLVLIRGKDGRAVHWLESTLRFIACEASSNRPGAETVINRLADVLFIQIVRGYLASTPEDTRGWLRALSDAQIGASLGLIHQRPESNWTVASLANKVGMSRSTFAGRFAELVGEPPLHYLTRWRMQKAAALLRDGQATLADIADRVGYESEAAFSKAFKRWVGTAPGAYRRAAKNGALTSAAA